MPPLKAIAAALLVLGLSVLLPSRALFGSQELFQVLYDMYAVPGTDGVFLDVHYLQTETDIVEEMLNLLNLRSGDVLYDLGCGDGIIVVKAAQRPGVRGVGIDLDPRRVGESRANAVAAQVVDKTIFIQQDLFESDIQDATAVTLYLLNEINVRLRPKLFRELKPGTRIVSHNFHMRDWQPDKKVSLGLRKDGFHNLFYWVLPANASGLWQGRYMGEPWTLSLRQRFQKAVGSLTINGKGPMELQGITITGDTILFTIKRNGQEEPLTFEGRVTGNTMEGIVKDVSVAGNTWKAIRKPGTMSRID